jgi:hypothetical protein
VIYTRASNRFRCWIATQALETLRVQGARGGNHVLDADIHDYFAAADVLIETSQEWASTRCSACPVTASTASATSTRPLMFGMGRRAKDLHAARGQVDDKRRVVRDQPAPRPHLSAARESHRGERLAPNEALQSAITITSRTFADCRRNLARPVTFFDEPSLADFPKIRNPRIL